jgi:anti-sigma factor ChrR (cupin superfamily)
MSDKSLFVDTDQLDWRETPYAGVRWKKLAFDRQTGRSAVILRFEPGAVYGAHRHPGGEEYLVLDGSLEDGGRSYGKGTYVYHPPGSTHKPASAEGCLLFVSLPAPIEDLESDPNRR